MKSFTQTLTESQIQLTRSTIDTLQINLGKLCNQACNHCHVEAGPLRTENMTELTINQIKKLINNSTEIKTIDLTGGAPELNPHFRQLVEFANSKGIAVIDRCNLTVLFEKGQEDLLLFFKKNHVHVVASLPCYTESNVDKQRGNGVFEKSIKAIQLLNEAGYGIEGSGFVLDLVYNPGGAFLPGSQSKLEQDYKQRLFQDFKITFNHLYTITNMPIKRFHDDLVRSNKFESYMNLLEQNFNKEAAKHVMCTSLISIGYDGKIYDCDFNQMLEMPTNDKKSIWDIENFNQITSEIVVDNHCYGCTAGSGSSCGGSLT